MFRTSNYAAIATFTLGLASNGLANTNVLLNPSYNQIGPNGNPVNMNILGQQQSGPSAAADWFQFKVDPNSTLFTEVRPIGIGLIHKLYVYTTGGPYAPASMGNGMGQSFPTMGCATASFYVNVFRGEVTGNLVLQTGPFASYPIFKPNNGIPKFYQQVVFQPVLGLWFETLHGAGAEYTVNSPVVQPCLSPVPVKDLTQNLTYEWYWSDRNAAAPIAKVRVTNHSSATIDGPILLMLEDLTPGRSVINPDGDYVGTTFVTMTSTKLAPGQFEDVTIQFSGDPAGILPNFRLKPATGRF